MEAEAIALTHCENQMRLLVAGKVPPYDAAWEIWSKAMSTVHPSCEVMHAMWLIWGALTDWVENRPDERAMAEAAMVRAAQEWLSLPDVTERKAYLDRWVYDEMGYERPEKN